MNIKNSLTDIDLNNIHTFNLDINTREVYLHSYIGETEEEPGVDYRCSIIFEKNIRYLNLLSIEPILVHMHLPGGSWGDCLAMYDTIRSSKAKIVILAYTPAESASSVLLQAGHLRILMPNANLMIHYGSISMENEHSKAAASNVKWNDGECEKMVDIFTERCMSSNMAKTKNWKKMMAKKHIISQINNKSDWILTAQEAVDYGFADGLLGTKKFPNIDYLKNYAKKI